MSNQFCNDYFPDGVNHIFYIKSIMEPNTLYQESDLIRQLEVLKKELSHVQEQRVRAEVERDIYKRLYEDERVKTSIPLPYIKTDPCFPYDRPWWEVKPYDCPPWKDVKTNWWNDSKINSKEFISKMEYDVYNSKSLKDKESPVDDGFNN